MPPERAKRASQRLERLDDRHGVEHGQPLDRAGMVQGRAQRDVRTSIVSDHREALVAELAHQLHASRAMARLQYGAWSGVVGGFDDCP